MNEINEIYENLNISEENEQLVDELIDKIKDFHKKIKQLDNQY